MCSVKVLVFLLGAMLIFMEFHKASAASLFEDLDGRRVNQNKLYFTLANRMGYAWLVLWMLLDVILDRGFAFLRNSRFIL